MKKRNDGVTIFATTQTVVINQLANFAFVFRHRLDCCPFLDYSPILDSSPIFVKTTFLQLYLFLSMRLAAIILFSFLLSGFPFLVQAQESQEVQAEVTQVQSTEVSDGRDRYELTATDAQGNVYQIDTADSHTEGVGLEINQGDQIYLQILEYVDGTVAYFFVDVIRLSGLITILGIFVLVTILVGGRRGAMALIGLAVTLFILFKQVLPAVLSGFDPVLAVVLGSVAILAVNMSLSHGLGRDTLIAYAATLVGLLLAWAASTWFVALGQLSGLASEEANYLLSSGLPIDLRGLLLAGIILGAVGVLDDIAITQVETVEELKQANPSLKSKELFTAAMRVGRHHIASTVNTLVLAYVGASMSLFVLMISYAQDISLARFLNTELLAEEIVRTLAGTVALVLTVPVATWFATLKKKR